MTYFDTERRPWGNFEVLADGPGYKVKRLFIAPGGRLSLQSHRHRSEHWHIARGRGIAVIDGEEIIVQAGNSADIPQNIKHRLENTGKETLVIIEIWRGERLEESDVVRYEDDYGRPITAVDTE
ncbi:MAG: phosphomannose isomerase type II C-terminal cupin domain [Candidatus Coatesbacteria bacterium]|nr:phosphomannose isomerase type II C-terminal cupin domain [Candidatus Coatesbacteria bacterium]